MQVFLYQHALVFLLIVLVEVDEFRYGIHCLAGTLLERFTAHQVADKEGGEYITGAGEGNRYLGEGQ